MLKPKLFEIKTAFWGKNIEFSGKKFRIPCMLQRPSFMSVSPEETGQVKRFLDNSLSRYEDGKWRGYRQRRRAQIILFSLQGWTARKIAREFQCSEQTVWKWRKIYRQKGLEGLKGKYCSTKL